MSSTVSELTPLPIVADDSLEQAASRLHMLVDKFLVNARSRKQDNESFLVNATSSKIKIDPKEIPLREALAETCRRVAALAVDPIEELSTIAYQVWHILLRTTKFKARKKSILMSLKGTTSCSNEDHLRPRNTKSSAPWYGYSDR